jgi:hypothetical protein
VLVDGVWPLGWLEMRILTVDGKPFTPDADLSWDVPALRRKTRTTRGAEQARLAIMKAQQEAERRAKEAEARTEERQRRLADEFMDFLRGKQGGGEE